MDDVTKLLLEQNTKIAQDIGEIKVTLAMQHISLEDHIKRTELLEDRIDPLEDHYRKIKIVKDWTMFALKVIPVITAIIVAIANIKRFL